MKKYTLVLVIGATLSLMACGSGSTSTEVTDSVAVQVDTAAVTAVDSTTAQIPDGNGSKEESQPVK